MQPDRPAASATTHKSLIMFFLPARIVEGGRILIRNEVCPNVTGRARRFDQFIGVCVFAAERRTFHRPLWPNMV
jgi:hypothetical protein